ncbi:uncharacterized protein RB166_016631 [Leptodactylus fuscus]|uniref:uncharacterized protein LOC142217153 n=1 Tax=Leptodactylus fuscus TaxID=238119 RepID=UPI003F4ECA7F
MDGKPINLQYLAIIWEFKESAIVRFDNKGLLSQKTKRIDANTVKEGVADLYISDASVSDIGAYRCTVIYSPNIIHKDIDFTVYARPSISAIEKIKIDNDQNKFLCSVTGFYPEQITVQLIKDGSYVNSSVISSLSKNNNTFSINSSVILPSIEKPKSIICKVDHESLTAPIQKDIRLVYDENGNITGLLVGVVLGVVIFIVSVIAAVLYKKKSGSSDVLVYKVNGTKMIEGENTALYCTACNCSQKTQVKWIIKNKDGTTCEITEKESQNNEEEQPLMPMEYKMSTEKAASQKRKSLCDITAKLSFIPSVSRHLGSSVTCSFITDKKSEARTHEIKDIYAKPQFTELVQFTITNQGDIQLATSLGRFYPQPLQISWVSTRGQSQEKILSEEEVMKNPDDTFNLTSKCTVPGEIFKDPTYKVIVTWKHESVDSAQSKEISVKDLPWRPHIRDYIESIIEGDKISFKCSVSNYFPDALTVKWFEKRNDFPDLLEILESEKFTSPQVISSRTDKKTFMALCSLSPKKSLLIEKDVELICRVDHPSLEEPIEAKTIPVQFRDTAMQTLLVNNIQGPQKWYDGEKVILYCLASYCTQNTQVIWIVTEQDGTEDEICEDSGGAAIKKDVGSGYVAHRERTDMSDIEGLLDITSCLSFTPSVSKHKKITLSCRILCEGRGRQKTFQRKQLYAKPKVLNPIKLSLTDSGDVLCALDIEDFYPSDVQIKWNDKENLSSDKTFENADGTYSVHSEYKLPGSFFRDPQSTVKISWKHESMDDWEWREICAVDKDFPWRPELREISIPNLLVGIPSTLKCEVSNVFPNVLNVKWLKREKDSEELFPLVHSDKYMISDITPVRQKDNTYTYKACLKFTPSVTTDQGAEFIFRVEHPSLGKTAEKSSGPLSIQDFKSCAPAQENIQTDSVPQDGIKNLAVTSVPQKLLSDFQRLIVGDIKAPDQWTHGKKVTLQCPVSYCPEDVTVIWMVTEGDGKVQEASSTAAQPLKEREVLKISGYFLTTETDECDVEGLYNITSIMTFIPTVRRHYGSLITHKLTFNGETRAKTFQPKSVHAKPQVLDPCKVTLTESGDVMCSLTLQNFYPKHIKVTWTTEQSILEAKEDFQENADHTYNICSQCNIHGSLFKDPNFKLSVTWRHKAMTENGTKVLSWRDLTNSFPWRPVIQEVPIPHVLMGQQNTLQYNISGYFPDNVTVSWYKKKEGALESVQDSDKYKTSVTEPQRQPDSTYSCTASLRFIPSLRDQGSELICRVEHPSLDRPIERSSRVLCVQGKTKIRKPVKVTLGKEEVKYSLKLENFYPKEMQIEWFVILEQGTQTRPSTEIYKSNLDKTYSVTSECRVSEKDLQNPNFRVFVMWSHESMDDSETRAMSIRDKDYPYRPDIKIQVPPLYNNTEASLDCTVYNYFPGVLHGMWLKKDKLSGETHDISGDGAYRISNSELGRQPNNTYSYRSCLIFTPSVESDQGAEFIYQVEHPSLLQPIQKSTGALKIDDSGATMMMS